MSNHVMVTEATVMEEGGTGEVKGWVVQCPDCSRRNWFPKGGGMETIDRGAFYAIHSWSSTPGFLVGATIRGGDE